jgi:FixJ family two-component response regulator
MRLHASRFVITEDPMGESTRLEPVVFIVDDDDGIRHSLKVLIESVGLRAQAYASPAEFLEAFDGESVGCLILDVRMPQMSGLTLQKTLKEKGISIPVIFVTGHGDVPMAVSALKEGAIDFLEKPLRQQGLLDSIQTAINHDIRNREINRRSKIVEAKLALLSERESEIFALIMQGLPNKLIAKQLDLSTRTVEVHRASIFDKLGVHSFAELVKGYFSYASEAGIARK